MQHLKRDPNILLQTPPTNPIILLKERIIKVETLLQKYADLSQKYNNLEKLQSTTLENEMKAKRDATKYLEKFSKLVKKNNTLLTTVESLESAAKEKENKLVESQRELERVGSVVQMYELERKELLLDKKDKQFLLSSMWKVLKETNYKGDMVDTIFKRFEKDLADMKLSDFRTKRRKLATASSECREMTLLSPELQSVRSIESDFIDVDSSPVSVHSQSMDDVVISFDVANAPDSGDHITTTPADDKNVNNGFPSLYGLPNDMDDVTTDNGKNMMNSSLEDRISETSLKGIARPEGKERIAERESVGLYEDESEEENCSHFEIMKSDDKVDIVFEVSGTGTKSSSDEQVTGKCYDEPCRSTKSVDYSSSELLVKRNFISWSKYPETERNSSPVDKSLKEDGKNHLSVTNASSQDVVCSETDGNLSRHGNEEQNSSIVRDSSCPKNDTTEEMDSGKDEVLLVPVGYETEVCEKEPGNKANSFTVLTEANSIFDVPNGETTPFERKSVESSCGSESSLCLEFLSNKESPSGSRRIRQGTAKVTETDESVNEATVPRDSNYTGVSSAEKPNKSEISNLMETLPTPEMNERLDEEVIGVLKNVFNVRLISPLREKEPRKRRVSPRKKAGPAQRDKLLKENIGGCSSITPVKDRNSHGSKRTLRLTHSAAKAQQTSSSLEKSFKRTCFDDSVNSANESCNESSAREPSQLLEVPTNGRPKDEGSLFGKTENNTSTMNSLTQTENSLVSTGSQTLTTEYDRKSVENGDVPKSLVRQVYNKIWWKKLEPKFRALDRLEELFKSQSSWSAMAARLFEDFGFNSLKCANRKNEVTVSFVKGETSDRKVVRERRMMKKKTSRKMRMRKRSLWSVENIEEDQSLTKESNTNFFNAKERVDGLASTVPIFGRLIGNGNTVFGESRIFQNPLVISDRSFGWFVPETREAKTEDKFPRDWDCLYRNDPTANSLFESINSFKVPWNDHVMDSCVPPNTQSVSSCIVNDQRPDLDDNDKHWRKRVSCKDIRILTSGKSEWEKTSEEQRPGSPPEIETKTNVVRRSTRIQNKCKRLKLVNDQTDNATTSLEPPMGSGRETTNCINTIGKVEKESAADVSSTSSSVERLNATFEQIFESEDPSEKEVVERTSLSNDTVITRKRRLSRIGSESMKELRTPRRSEVLKKKKVEAMQTSQSSERSVDKSEDLLDSILTAMTKQMEESMLGTPATLAKKNDPPRSVDVRPDLRTCLLKPCSLVTEKDEDTHNGFLVADACRIPQPVEQGSVRKENDSGKKKENSNTGEGRKMNKLVEKVIKNFLKAKFTNVKEAEDLLSPCLAVLQNASDETIASVMVSEVLANVDEELQNFERPIPPLTQTQHRFIIILTVLGRFDSVTRQILKRIWFKLFPDTFFWPDDSIEAATRFYSALCKKSNDFKQLWRFCFKAVTSMRQRWCIVVLVALQTWPDILLNASQSQRNVLVETFANVILQTPQKEEKRLPRQKQKLLALKHLLLNFYNFEVTKSIESFAQELFESLRSGVPGAVDAMVFLTRSRSWAWAEKCILPKLSQAMMEWSTGALSDESGFRVLSVVEKISSRIPAGDGVASPVADLISKLSEVLSKNVNPELKKRLIKGLCSLSHQRVAKDILISLLGKFAPGEQIHEDISQAIACSGVKMKTIGKGKKVNTKGARKNLMKVKTKKKKKCKKKPIVFRETLALKVKGSEESAQPSRD